MLTGFVRAHEARLAAMAGRIDAFSEATGKLVSWFTLGMVLVTFLVVVLRYAFDLGWIAMQESVTYLHALVFMLGAAYTLKHDAHVRVDIFYRKASAAARARIDLLGTLLLLFPVCGFILWSSHEYVSTSWAIQESSRETGGLPGVFLLKTLIPAMAILLLVQGMADILRALLQLGGIRRPVSGRGIDAEL